MPDQTVLPCGHTDTEAQTSIQHELCGPTLIRVTRDQMDILVDAVIPDPDPAWREYLCRIPGGQTVLVDTVEESTPYALGMLGPEVFEVEVPMVVPLKRSVRPLTQNDRFHYMVRARFVGQIREGVHWAAKQAKIPPGQHLTVQLHYAPGDNRSVTDAPNLTATSKPAIDGLVDAGLVPDDTDKHVTERMPVIRPGGGPRRCWLTVEVQR